MRHLALALCTLAGLSAACSDDSSTGATDVDSLKQQAKRSFESALQRDADSPVSSADDPCVAHKWYGDGACDSWCPGGDADDCTTGSDSGVACAEFFSPADGKCDWSDPCAPLQDEDCQRDPPVECIAIAYETNGTCEAAKGCEASDPVDCQLACIEIAFPHNGKCEAARSCEYTDPVDCKLPRACDAIGYLKDGVCSAPAGCEANDPDCR